MSHDSLTAIQPTDRSTDHVTRERIMSLLSEIEVARVSPGEIKTHLVDGDEYVDLQKLAQGVCRARGSATRLSDIVPRKAVRETTWSSILRALSGAPTSEGT